jgi:hypothetical protein
MKKINKCHHWDPIYGCGISPQKNCASCSKCPNADWQTVKSKQTVSEYLESLTKDAMLSIIKYGLRESNAPDEVTVEDIYECIGCEYISEKM